MRRYARHAAVVTGVLAGLLAGSTALAGVKPNPENNAKLGPTDNAGAFMGYPTPTYQWHGCKLTSRAKTFAPDIGGAPAFGKGTKQGAVTFEVSPTKPFVTWKVRAGYKICGVQVSAVLSSPDDNTDHYAEVGYTSGPTKGSTVKAGFETIKVKVSKKDPDPDTARDMGGKTYSITQINDVTVFVKKK